MIQSGISKILFRLASLKRLESITNKLELRIIPTKNILNRVIPITLLLVVATGCSVTQKNTFQFALIGDNPYTPTTYSIYERMIDEINSHTGIEWVLHVGDVKGASSSCSDEELSRHFDLNQGFDKPFIVTPGDNDWLDCKRAGAGGYDEYERLDAFRRIFYPVSGHTTGGKPMQVRQQSSTQQEFSQFVENAIWQKQGVVFATVHVVALTVPATDPRRWEKRVAAASAWIRQVFEEARTTSAKGVFLAMQADPWIFFGLPEMAENICPNCIQARNSLEWLYPLLAEESTAFEKPVVLAVGDTHIFRVDKPLYTDGGDLVSNFTRVESFGNPLVNWVSVLVEPESPWVFSFREQLVAQ